MFNKDWTMCLKFVNHSKQNFQHHWMSICCLLMVHCEWILLIHNNSRVAPNFMQLILASLYKFMNTQKTEPRESKRYKILNNNKITN